MAAMLRAGLQPRRDIVFSGVVQEEIGGTGAEYWVRHLDYPVDLVVLGEPSNNNISLGHRGIIQMWVTFHGRSVHASTPEKGDNPNFLLAAFLEKLRLTQSELSTHELLGPTSVTPTIIEVDTKSPNVTPAWTRVLLDFRTASESSNSLQAYIQRLAGEAPYTITDAWRGDPQPLENSADPIFGYYTPPESDVVQRVAEAISRGMGRAPEFTSYPFATDGRHFVPYGLPIIGYAPGDENLMHTVNESISIPQMAEALRGYVGLLREF
jgi:acetylornithine deacetylase/succinyl-diaminopimelate desuccinylase-like protein